MSYIVQQMNAPEELQIAGLVINQFRENLTRAITDPIMNAHGLTSIDNETFYPASIMDAIYSEIASVGNGMQAFVAMGKASAKTSLDFSNPESPEDVLNSIHDVFTTYLRNMPDGFGIIVTYNSATSCEVWNNTQVPNYLIYGYLWECIRVTCGGSDFTIELADNAGLDSSEGARYKISWKA